MSKSFYCSRCGSYLGDCGHAAWGSIYTVTLEGDCKCGAKFSVSCDGDCLKQRASKPEEGVSSALWISEDGRSIVDSSGQEVATFKEDFVVNLDEKSQGGRLKIPGHLECKKECVAWDSNAKCVKYINSCTWVFPPFDF